MSLWNLRAGELFFIGGPRFFCTLSVLLVVGCATYQGPASRVRDFLSRGEPAKAVNLLEAKAKSPGKDQVVFLLDYALSLHQQGEFAASNKAFLLAEDLADVKDFTSISRESAVFLTSERLREYKSERFENILINGYLALNFLLLGEYDDALVECRKIDEKLHLLKLEGESASKSFFARYLSAMIWEAQGRWDSAYIDFKNAYDIDPSLEYLKTDLIRSAWRSGRQQALRKWQKKWPSVSLETVKKQSVENGNLILIYQQGWVPQKMKRPEDYRFPMLRRVPAAFQSAKLWVGDKRATPTVTFYDLSSDAIKTMDAYYKVLVAKKIAGEVAKQILAREIDKKNEGLGSLLYLAMKISDQADLRQWSTLPSTFQIARVSVPPGKVKVRVDGQGRGLDRTLQETEIDVRKGKTQFLIERTF